MSYVIYGTACTRITLYDTNGTATARITLQVETREGLTLAFKPEGSLHELGSGAGWAKHWSHRGFRPSLAIRWDVGVLSSRETWTGSAWGAPAEITTAEALSQILNSAFLAPCQVEPHLDHSFAFLAQPDPSKAFELRDRKRVVHTGLALDLIGCGLAALPTWVQA